MKHSARRPPRLVRCAIYTRKSTEYGLEQEFSSLEAQREAGEAYVKSQASEGWRLLPERYDDGGYSGGSLERPALQMLLAEVRAQQVDVIVVYKVDRLTRSLSDFAKLVELFDAHGVSFVSVTQAFNTTNSMGRLTLNVLLSFAQFEREVTSERIRDKVAAAKRKGLRMGGPVPLGYRVVDKKLVIDEREAKAVTTLFQLYRDLGSLRAVLIATRELGMVTKRVAQPDGKVRGGIPFARGSLGYLLRNRAYVGEVVHHGSYFPGDHAPIVARELFDAVQAKLASQAVERRRSRYGSGALLLGRILDENGRRMTPTHTNREQKRHRYYASRAPEANGAGSGQRVRAPELEEAVIDAIRRWLDRHGVRPIEPDDRKLIEEHLAQVVVCSDQLVMDLALFGADDDESVIEQIKVPWSGRPKPPRREVLPPPGQDTDTVEPMRADVRATVLVAIARARQWFARLEREPRLSLADIAAESGCTERYVRMLLPLAFLAPEVVAAIVERRVADGFGVTRLATEMPMSWAEQKRWVGLA